MYKLEYFGQISEDGLLKITNRKGNGVENAI